MFDEVFRARVLELWNLFSATGALSHHGQKGTFREEFVKQIFESVLPVHYGIGSGVVVDKWRRQSPQIDLVIYDKRGMPPLLERDGHGIYPIDSVLRVLEVKSVIDASAVDQFISQAWAFNPNNPAGLKLASAGNLEGGQAYYPLCGLFGFGTEIKNILHAVNSRQKEVTSGLVFCDDRGVIILNAGGGSLTSLEDRVENIKFFIATFCGAIEEAARSRSEFNPLDWFTFKSREGSTFGSKE